MQPIEIAANNPICPHCEREVGHLAIHYQTTRSRTGGGDRQVVGVAALTCPHCRKIVGVTNTAGMETV